MNWKKRMIFALLTAALCLATLSGCDFLEQQQRKREQRQKLSEMASETALDYVSGTYGGKAQVLDIKLGTSEAGFTSYLTGEVLVTVSLDEEEFQVYVDLNDSPFCADNRSGIELANALDEYFRGLYDLPPALEHSINVYSRDNDFFASWSTNPAHDYNFLDFDYHGQPLEEILPLLDKISFIYSYADDSVTLDQIEFCEEDWGGPVERLSVWLRCFRCYDEDSEIPLGIQVVDGQPIMMAEGMVFSLRYSSYGSLTDIATGLPNLSLRENLRIRDGKTVRQHYTVTRMGNFWVSTQKGFTAEECYELRPCELDWADSIDLLAQSASPYYSIAEIRDGTEVSVGSRNALLPFMDAQFQTEGEMLCLREGVLERIQEWKEQTTSWYTGTFPVTVTVIPSLVYQSDAQMGVGRIWEEEDGAHHAAQLFTAYLDEEDYWTHGLSFLTYYWPDELVLLSVAEQEHQPSIWERFTRFIIFR